MDALAEEEQKLEAVVESLDKTCTRYKVAISAEKTKKGYRYHKLRKAFSNFYPRHFDIVSKYNVGLKISQTE